MIERGSEPASWPPEDGRENAASDSSIEESEASPGSRRDPHRRGLHLAVLALSVVLAVGWNVWQLRIDLPEPSPRSQEAGARVSLLVAAQAVDEWWRAQGALPDSLAQIGFEGSDIAYQRTGDGYRLTAEGTDREIRRVVGDTTDSNDSRRLLEELELAPGSEFGPDVTLPSGGAGDGAPDAEDEGRRSGGQPEGP